MLIRAMSPAVVAVDELGKEEDFRAVEAVIHSGCRLIATAHGENVEAVLATPFFAELKKCEYLTDILFWEKKKEPALSGGFLTEGEFHAEICRHSHDFYCRDRHGDCKEYGAYKKRAESEKIPVADLMFKGDSALRQ